MKEGIECYVENVNNSKGIVVITKSKEAQKFLCTRMLFKIIREIHQAKDMCCENVVLHQYLIDSVDPASFRDESILFTVSEVNSTLREGYPLVVSVNGKGRLDAVKITHLIEHTLWGKCI